MEYCDAVVKQYDLWLGDVLSNLKCETVEQLTSAKCQIPVKSALANHLHGALILMNKQREVIEQLRNSIIARNEDLIESQKSVVKLQEQLIANKDEKLQALEHSVLSSVQETVKAELKSYSDVVVGCKASTVQTIAPETLKSVVKSVVEHDDRGKNLMIFGLPDEEEEILNDKVYELCETLGEKPRVDATRLGKRCTKNEKIRPVKVVMSSSAAVYQILSKAKKLRGVEKFKTVYLTLDRTEEDRIKQRELVQEMKKLSAEKREMRHFIRDCKVVCVKKT